MRQMPAPTDSSDMEELYKGGDSEQAGDKSTQSVDQQNAEEMTKKAVLPMSVLMGDHTEPLNVGDEVVLKISAIHGDQAEVEYSETPPGEIGHEEAGGPGGEESPNDEIDRLSKEY